MNATKTSPLRKAIEDLPIGRPIVTDDKNDVWPGLARGCLTTWAHEYERDLEIADARLSAASERSGIAEIGLDDPEAPQLPSR